MASKTNGIIEAMAWPLEQHMADMTFHSETEDLAPISFGSFRSSVLAGRQRAKREERKRKEKMINADKSSYDGTWRGITIQATGDRRLATGPPSGVSNICSLGTSVQLM